MWKLNMLKAKDLLNVIGERVDDLDSVVYIDIGASNNYKVIKGFSIRGGSLIIEVGER